MAIIHNKPASAYDQPHTMSDKPVTGVLSQTTGAKVMDEMNISVGNINKGNEKGTKTSGIKIRGTGAATKGVMARGPMC
jgi:hypothetical protein